VGLGCEVLSSFEVYHLIKTPTLCSVHSDAGGFVPGFVCNNPNEVLKLWTLHISLSLSLSLSLHAVCVFFMSVLQPGSIREGILCVEIYKIGFFLVEKWAFCCVNAKRDERVVALKWKIFSQLSSLHFMLRRSSKWTESWNSCSRAYCVSVVLCTL
jgi:hypothetical protein